MDLSAALQQHGLSDKELGQKLGVSSEIVRRWRLGKQRPGTGAVIRLEEQLGIPRSISRPDLWPPSEAAA